MLWHRLDDRGHGPDIVTDVHHGQHAQARPFHPREGCELCSLSRMLTSELRLKENTDWANADIVVALAPRKTSKEKVQP